MALIFQVLSLSRRGAVLIWVLICFKGLGINKMCNEYIPVMESRTTCWLVSKHKQVGALSGISISLKMISPVFPGANGEMFSALEEVNLLPQHPLSARERRRLKQRALESAVHVRTDRCNVSQFLCFHSDSMSWLLREYTCSYLPFKKDAV